MRSQWHPLFSLVSFLFELVDQQVHIVLVSELCIWGPFAFSAWVMIPTPFSLLV